MSHPCRTCGACCSTWAVQFERREAKGPLRAYVVAAATPKHVVMAGTETEPARCSCLTGVVGGRSGCSIYAHRPSPCREVLASLEDGHRDPTCDEARARHGLAKLTFADW